MYKMNTKRLIIKLFMLFGCVSIVTPKTGPSHNKVVVCYVSTWAVYRPDRGSYAIENIDPNLCTHIVYAFAGLDHATDAIKSLDPWQDLKDNYGKGGFERIVNLRKTHPHLKISLAIGGWNEGSKNYSRMAADPSRRNRFVKSATEFVLKYNFDGLDLDWEYPTQREGHPFDKQNFVLLCKELKQSFRPHNLLLTSAIGASINVINQAYDIENLNKHLDYLHIMCYDYGGAWDKKITANAPLNSDNNLNVIATIEHLIRLGASPSKIVMGLPFYGRTFITNLDGNFEDPSLEQGFTGPYTRENGFMGYNEICDLLTNKASGWTSQWDESTSQGVARFKDTSNQETRVAVYDTTRSIVNKVRYAVRNKLAGSMIWSVDTDDFRGECVSEDDTYADFLASARPGIKLNIPKRINTNYPLLRSINEATVIALDEVEAEAASGIDDKDNEIPHGDVQEDGKGSAGRFTLCFSTILLSALSFVRQAL